MSPWDAASFKKKHNKGLSKSKAKKAASIASAIVEKEGEGSAGKAIRIANAAVKK